MQIVVIKKDKLYKYAFPHENITNYWIKDIDELGNERELISIIKKENNWYIVNNDKCFIESKEKENILTLNNLIKLTIISNNISIEALLYICNENDPTFETYELINNGTYTIGKNINQNIIINDEYINEEHAILIINGKDRIIKAKDNNSLIYVNNIPTKEKKIENGDIIFIYGYKIIVINNYLVINNPHKKLKINNQNIIQKGLPMYQSQPLPTKEDDNAKIYHENQYYSRSPRFVTSIIEENLKIDNPPTKIEQDETPVLYTIGPMLTMSMSSIVSASISIINLKKGNGNLTNALPAIIISVTMLISTLLWPTLMRSFNKKRVKKKEALRQKKYLEYLTEKRTYIEKLKINQLQILKENFKEPSELEVIIDNKRRNLWERLIESEDFLRVRIGYGTIPLKIKLNYAIEEFTLREDNLKEEVKKIADASKEIENAPVTISLIERNKLVIIGEKEYQESMIKSIILQLTTYHSYNDLKLVFMLNNSICDIAEGIKILPHVWNNTRDIRFYGTNYDDISKISFYLEQVYTARKYDENDKERKESNLTYKDVSPYYLIIVDNIKKNKNVEIVKKILKEDKNIGFGLIILNDGISNLPNECIDFLTAAGEKSAIIKNDLNANNQQLFVMDSTKNINFPLLCEKLSNIPIKLPLMLDEIKSSIGFLEMYKVGKVEQLNILDRWEKNNPVNSLSVPIGIHTDGELFNLDLHEKFHGAHGLIAGMTGSGKSEFIITYILSMCLNFSPEEVSFVLIDYKGGGLTGAFENKLTGIRLPHLAGVITNLDKAEINRSLSSIESELKRRQTLFNIAKEKLNESTLDIYKYQKLYRDGLIEKPISHLFIITDEFAELKNQQPEFMDGLISTARIGRSLGVHLILATQKPSGIVDDQIWSNSKFKVCLKVQEKSDSMDVIKRPDAAALKKAGRFYLQVGYNDYFAMGQAAYAGTKYIPREKIAKNVDRNVSFIDDIGDIVKSVETVKREETISYGEELPNILKYICQTADKKHMVADKLWLDKIPDKIYVNNLINKYSYIPKKWEISAVVGEYDDPSHQKQGLLKLDFNDSGNTIIYGNSGKEIMLSSIIYSLIITHNSEELNIYVVDFGTEMFGIFKKAPQVGDVIYIHETEKLNNLFNVIIKELEVRKKLFVDYNGNYEIYIRNSGKTLPKYIIIINNYEALSENYEDYIDIISSLSREGEKYGIVFIITASGVNAIRTRTTQNFGNQICLQLNDSTDYSSIFGPTHGMVPSDILGRGLIKLNSNILEFQTAYPYIWDEINVFIKKICQDLNDKLLTKAKNIRILPDHVRIDDIKQYITNISKVPIGIVKKNLAISTFDFQKNPISLISSQDFTMLDKFIPSLGRVISTIPNTELHLIDPSNSIQDGNNFKNYYTNNYDEVLNVLGNSIKSNNSITQVFIFYGLDEYKNHLSISNQNKMFDLFNKIKANSNIKIIIADSISKLKLLEYESFYRDNVQPIYGIWIGSGITEQYTIKCSTYNKETRSQIENDFGYNINRGTATLVKLIDFYSKD